MTVKNTTKDYYDPEADTIKGTAQDVFAHQYSCYGSYPDHNDVRIHQMTSFLDKTYDMNNAVCIITSTYKGITKSHVYIDNCYLPTKSRAYKLFSTWTGLPVTLIDMSTQLHNI